MISSVYLFLDLLPNDASHLIAVHLHDRLRHLDALRSRNCANEKVSNKSHKRQRMYLPLRLVTETEAMGESVLMALARAKMVAERRMRLAVDIVAVGNDGLKKKGEN